MTKKQIESVLYGIGVDSLNRFETFYQLYLDQKIKGKNYWFALRTAYVSSDNLFSNSSLIKRAFLNDEPNREGLMDLKEIKYLKGLPQQITIYRGMTKNELKQKSFGLSWTLKKEVAEFFAFTYNRNYATNHLEKVVHQLTIDKKDVIAFINDRNEFEIIYNYNS